jgi:tetratricopeptide (TPR) repeat protein
MSDDSDERGARGGNNANALLAATLGTVSDNPRVDALLDREIALADLQIDNLRKEDEFEVSHLRWRRFNDQMKGAMQIMLVAVGALIVTGIAVTIWSAAHESGLVIEAFSVPPDMAAKGLTGQAVAAQLQDKLSAMQEATNSARPAASYTNDWGDNIKVQIPDTGVSVGEFYRVLVERLGHQTHITGEVWRTDKGISLTARVGSHSATVAGADSDFDTLLQNAAVAIYRRTQPYRYTAYLIDSPAGRTAAGRAEDFAILDDLATKGSPQDRLWSHIGLGVDYQRAGDFLRSKSEFEQAAALDPDFAMTYLDLFFLTVGLSHDEDALKYGRTALRLLQRDDGKMNADFRAIGIPYHGAENAVLTGDYGAALQRYRDAALQPDINFTVERSLVMVPVTLALMHDGAAARAAARALPENLAAPGRLFQAVRTAMGMYALADYRTLIAQHDTNDRAIRAAFHATSIREGFSAATLARHIWPFEAMAMAQAHDFKSAHALIDKTPTDCDHCLRARGVIDGLEKNWAGAQYWFARAVAHAPSVPLGYVYWGQMLLAKGDADGAIAKFQTANEQSPHFADPLEMWGEALIAKNRSDLALAKFAEANKYAPNWGRLHLKWGEALRWSGDKAGAKKQFAIAADLDMTTSEKAELAKAARG